ncbi:DZIP1L isoform 3, partial [Pan troglodytes]
QPPKVPSRMVPRPEDDWDWSDTETSEENAQPPGQGSGTLVQSMVKNLEKQLEAPAKKPAGGVSLFFMPNARPQRAATPGRKPQVGCRMLRVYSGILYRTSSEFGGPGVKVGEGPASVILCPSGTLRVTSLCPCAHGEMASLEYLYPS